MDRKKIVAIVAGGTMALVAAFGAVSYQAVKAQTPTTTPSAPAAGTTANNAAQPGFDRGMRGGAGVSDQDLATALGITLDKLQAAETTAQAEALKQAVADGVITQSQADQFSQNSQNGQPMRGLPFLRDSNIDYNALLAKALGISTDDLKAANQKVYFANLDTAVKNGNMTQSQADLAKANYLLTNSSKFQTAMKSAYQTAVNQAVTDGLITQAQADLILKNSSGMQFGMPGGFGGPGGPGGRGGHGGPDGWGGAPQGSSTTPANPSTAPTAAPTSGSGA